MHAGNQSNNIAWSNSISGGRLSDGVLICKLQCDKILALWKHVSQCFVFYIRVESGSDDPDNMGHLGHFFDGSSGSHPQTKLSGCDPNFSVH